MGNKIEDAAISYHRQKPSGKLEVVATKPLVTSYDLSLAYSPGVAKACELIEKDPREVGYLTTRSNLVGIITNGSAVLGLGNIGPLASKPVMEGKAVLFKRFANINAFDIELDCQDIEKFCQVVQAMEPTFGGINLEDICSPQCFHIERILSERMNIPIFHDDQHGTAIVVVAALTNALLLVDKKIEDIQLVCVGAGAAGIACLNLLCEVGLRRENIIVADIHGIIRKDRAKQPDEFAQPYATERPVKKLADALEGADVFLGLSAEGVLKPQLLKKMERDPIIFAMANPNPEIMPDLATEARSDCIIATGRSDFANQINNVLCFPFIFRGALDVGARKITKNIKILCADAIAKLAREPIEESVLAAYGLEQLQFGRQSLLPKPFDPRLMTAIAPVVAQEAMDANIADYPIEDMDAYAYGLAKSGWSRTNALMEQFRAPNQEKKLQVVFADGEDARVLHTAHTMVKENIARPVLIGRRAIIQMYCKRFGIKLSVDKDYDLVDPQDDKRYRQYWEAYRAMRARHGVSPQTARAQMRTDSTLIGTMLVKMGVGDVLICGLVGDFNHHLERIKSIIGLKPGYKNCVAVSAALLKDHSLFIADTQVHHNPTAEELVEIARLSAEVVKQMGLEPNLALISHTNFGNSNYPEAVKVRKAVEILHNNYPELAVEGELDAELALNEQKRLDLFPDSLIRGKANLMIMPNIDTANTAFQILKMTAADHNVVESVLEGVALPCHILHPASTARGILNFVLYNCRRSALSEKTLAPNP